MKKAPEKDTATDEKSASLDAFRVEDAGTTMTTDQGIPIGHTDDSLKAGVRGPTLLEDFHLREKITRFDHERIPERVVHARGSAAHGYFQAYASQASVTKAKFLCDPARKTPVFVRFSTVVGSRGAMDTARDVRGFATKFYTDEGNFDLVGNNMPVFFIQDGIKFPDLVHAVKPEPHNEMPQGASAHDTFWDFVSLVPETAHMVMWVMSDRGIPRSYRMMEGFGVHTFRLVNDAGKSHLVKFHWKPLLGVHSLVWDEAQKLGGKDGDFHRRDLWDAIEAGAFPEYELGLQIIEEADALKYGFDMIDPTKLLPEELVPVQRVGKMTLNRNPDNFFAETEQVAFCVANVVPGIDFTNDPLMQARLFSYLDTQLTRLGGPNFAELPINRPVAPVHNHQQDGFGRQTIPTTRANYHPNSIGGGCPVLAAPKAGFTHFAERLEGQKTRERSESFADHFSQATMFFKSLTPPEQKHLLEAFQFELGKVEREEIRQRVVDVFASVDVGLATAIADGIGVKAPAAPKPVKKPSGAAEASPALSMEGKPKVGIKSRKVAFLVEGGFDDAQVAAGRVALEAEGAKVEVVSRKLGTLKGAKGAALKVDKSYLTGASIFFDAVFVPGGAKSAEAMKDHGDAIHFVNEAFRHGKAIGAAGEGVDFLLETDILARLSDPKTPATTSDKGVVTDRSADTKGLFAAFIGAIEKRHWDRDDKATPA